MTTDNTDVLAPAANATWINGISRAIMTLENVTAEIAQTNMPILFVGESGTGKEMFAQRIHRLSHNSIWPLVRISCASVKSPDFFAQLGLGPGKNDERFTQSQTILLDEIAELDACCQRDLLCALPDGEGEVRRGALNARLISTTSHNLDEEMRAGRFRSDLYYRISCICLRLPPLRERKEDIPLLIEFFLTKYAAQMQRSRPTLSNETLHILLDYSWPGNIRELENIARKIVALGDEALAVAGLNHAWSKTSFVPEEPTENHSLKAAARAASREAEREMILKALSRTRWNRKRAAQELQISYKSLLYKLKQIGFEDSGVNQ